MKENKYDDPKFFEQYASMARSKLGLSGAGEWYALKKMLPDFLGRRVLDLGCGFGWHCQYAAAGGARSVVGTDISKKMLAVAEEKNEYPAVVTYRALPMEELDFPAESFDVVISSLALHYVESFSDIAASVARVLTRGGTFVFSTEHPVFTAREPQGWICDGETRLHWPVDRYFSEGERDMIFLGEHVKKYHRTVETFVSALLSAGFAITGLREPRPSPDFASFPDYPDELRRPMFLLLSAKKR
ncbi:class I SAM-dependent methyltransferase [Oscillospiraceae bacterium OttesenSCG-928-G22]|nr:class I SAM-dependent methyltransferase [Oscillospiraceae bacterium OttesenSCG-928-G22]